MSSGTGSFRKKGRGYEYRIWMTMPDGSRKQKSFTGPTKTACRQKYERALQNTNEIITRGPSLGSFAAQWIELKQDTVSYRTWKNYHNYLENYVLPNLDPSRPLTAIKPMDIQKMMASCSHLSDSTRSDILLTAKQLFRCALDNDYIQKDPCKNIRIHKTDEIKELTVYTPEEITIIESHLRREPIGVGIALMLYAGLRTEEACALHWEDVDLEKDLLHIRRKIIIDHGNTCREVRSTKSRTLRTVPIPRALHDILSDQEPKPDNPYVLPYQSNRPYPYGYLFYSPHVFFERYEAFFKKLPIRYLSPHKLRHTYGTYLIRSGADMFTTQKLLGHSSITTTSIYANTDLSDQIKAVSKLTFHDHK